MITGYTAKQSSYDSVDTTHRYSSGPTAATPRHAFNRQSCKHHITTRFGHAHGTACAARITLQIRTIHHKINKSDETPHTALCAERHEDLNHEQQTSDDERREAARRHPSTRCGADRPPLEQPPRRSHSSRSSTIAVTFVGVGNGACALSAAAPSVGKHSR